MVVCSWFGCHGDRKLPLIYNGKMVKLHFYALPQKVASVLLYLQNFDCPSVCQGEHPRFRGYFWAILDKHVIMRYFEVYSF